MSICRGCGMVLGRDCFNEQDCMWISQSMQQMYEQEQCLQAENQDVDVLHERIQQLEQELASANEQLAEAKPYGYVTTLRNGTKHFYESMPYLDNAVKCDAVYLQAQAQQESRWISVEERLPDTDGYVFVYMPNNNYLKVGIDCWQMQKESPLSFSSQTVDIGMGWDDNEFEDVSHWMPLPPAPKGEKE